MNCLVTGGAGFIGSHLVERLLEDGHEVVVIDDFSEGKMEFLPISSRLHVQRASILDEIDDLFYDMEVVFHLAALPRPLLSIAEPKPAHRVNVDGLLNVLVACNKQRVRRVVFTSSATVYGEQGRYPTLEEAPLYPMSPYALHKVIGEQYCKLFFELYGLTSCCVRLFNVYGDRMNPDGFYSSLIPKFIKIIRNGGQPTIFGDGTQRRDFVHVSDVVEALMRAARPTCQMETYNVGSGINWSVNEVFQMICQLLDLHPEPIYGPKMMEPTQTLAGCNKAYYELGWQPRINLMEGIEQLL